MTTGGYAPVHPAGDDVLRALVETTRDGVAVITRAGGIIQWVNPVLATLLDRPPGELIGTPVVEVALPQPLGADPKVRDVARAVSADGSWSGRLEVSHGPGRSSVCQVEVRALSTAERGDVFLVVVTDVTAAAQLAERDREITRVTQELLDALPEAVTLADTEARITYVSRRTADLHGYDDPADLVGISALDLVAPHARERARQAFLQMLSAGLLQGRRFPLLRADGSTFLGELSAASLHDAAGRPRGAIAITRDISARERTAAELAQSQAQLRASELLYRTLVEASRDGILLTDADGRIVKCNERFAVMHGYPTATSLAGLSVFELYTPADRERARDTWEELFVGDGARHLQHTSLRRDGTAFPSDVSMALVRSTNGGASGVVAISRDVSKRVDAEVRLRDYQTHLRSLTAELSLAEERERRRIGMGLHDSVGQMLVFCGLRLGTLAGHDLPDEVTTALDEVRGQLNRAVEHTRTLIFELTSPVLYELGFEAAVRSDTERFARQSGIAFHFVDDGEPKPMADDVAVTLYQSVRELMTNAVKHARAANVLVSVARVADRACVTVDDDGCGFFPNGNPAANPARGYGLSSIRERIDHVGGEVTIESSRGRGTRVELRAPLREA